jgi:hypothetical protein
MKNNPIWDLGKIARLFLESAGKPRHYQILNRRYGLEDGKRYTLQEIGDYYNLSRERIRQIESDAIRGLRKCLLFCNCSYQFELARELCKELNQYKDALHDFGLIISLEDALDVAVSLYGAPPNRMSI